MIVDENDDDLQGRYFDELYEFIEHLVEHSTLLRGSDFAGDRDVRDTGSIPSSGRYPGEGNGNSLQYSCLENPMARGAW